MGNMSRGFTSIARSATDAGTGGAPAAAASAAESRWLGTDGSWSNHQRLSVVSRAPLSVMPGSSTKSKALTRSVATTSTALASARPVAPSGT